MILPPPQPPSNSRDFRWRSRAYHLTYAGHIPPEMLLQLLCSISSIAAIATSVVHEASDAEAPYNHTHFAWLWERAVDLTGSRLMDITIAGVVIHPNICTKKSLRWIAQVFTQYHRGSKEGSDKIVAPVAGPWQVIPESFEWNDYLTTQVSNARDVIDGVHMAGLYPKSITDVVLLQRHKRPAPFEHNFKASQFKALTLPPTFGTTVGTLQIYGGINLGKTEWACAQFDNPHLVTTREGLKGFRPEVHDGIVFDKMEFKDWTVTDCESLTDFTQPAQVRVLYGFVKIPKRTRKIVVTNAQDVWPDDSHNRIVGRRVAQLHIPARLF